MSQCLRIVPASLRRNEGYTPDEVFAELTRTTPRVEGVAPGKKLNSEFGFLATAGSNVRIGPLARVDIVAELLGLGLKLHNAVLHHIAN